MTFSNQLRNESFVASTDLSTRQYHIINLTGTNNKIDLAAARTGYGILQNKPQAGEHATVAVDGVSKCVAGAAVSIGDLITAAASGYASVVGSGTAASKQVIGRALTAAASGSVFSIGIDKQIIVATGGLPA